MTLFGRRTTVATVVLIGVLTGTKSSEAQGSRTQPLPLVWVLATGGTIAGRGTSTGVTDYKSGALAAEELVNLNPQKARILLMLALTKTRNRDEIRRMFLEY